MPKGAEILTVQMQRQTACLWALVNPHTSEKEQREIEMFGTGHPVIGGERKYISTVMLAGGDLVFHFFERMK